jgi:organic hydroperoxide reductase OsmC/OhrA
MSTMNVSLRNVPGTKAAMGWAGGHTLVIDRPEGRAGGLGLGFNGGQMIALAIGGCFCNDLRYVADAMGVALETIEVDVAIELEGKPLLVTSATMSVHVTAAEGVDVAEVIRRAEADSTVSNSVRAGFPVTVVAA